VVSFFCTVDGVTGHQARTGGILQDSQGDDRVRRRMVVVYQQTAKPTFRGPVPHNCVAFFISDGHLPPTHTTVVHTTLLLIASSNSGYISPLPGADALRKQLSRRLFAIWGWGGSLIRDLGLLFPRFASHDRRLASRDQGLATRCLDLDRVPPDKANGGRKTSTSGVHESRPRERQPNKTSRPWHHLRC